MERIAIFAALPWECHPVLRQIRGLAKSRLADFTVWRGRAHSSEIWLVKTGIGMQRAGQAARVAIDASDFDLLLSTGCAGALAPELLPGDLTIATALIDSPAGRRFALDAKSRARAHAAAERAGLRVILAAQLCSPQVLASVADKRAAAAATGAVAVDMESAAIAACATEAGVAFASVRAILDAADTDLDASAGFIDTQSGGIKPLALAAHLVRHPNALPRLLEVQRMMRAAQTSLTKFFAAWLSQ